MKKTKRVALSKLLSGATNAQAASAAGVATRTVERWRSGDDEFRAAMRRARQAALGAVFNALVSHGLEAVQILADAMRGDAVNSQRLAADSVIDKILKLNEIFDVEERLAKLEDFLNEQGKS